MIEVEKEFSLTLALQKEISERTKKSISNRTFNWTSCLNYIKANGLAGLCQQSAKNYHGIAFPPTFSREIKNSWICTTLQNEKRFTVFERIVLEFNKYNIEIMPLKGMLLASKYYDTPGLRPMGDIDFIVPVNKVYQARNILKKMGAVPMTTMRSKFHEKFHPHLPILNLNGLLIELHHHLFSKGSIYYFPIKFLWKKAIPTTFLKGKILVPSPDHLLYHLVGHFNETNTLGGSRLSWVFDIQMVINHLKQEKIDHQTAWLTNFSQKSIIAANKSLKLSNDIFHCPTTPTATQFINKVGNEKKGDKRKSLLLFLRQLLHLSPHQAIRLLFYEIFPSKQYMQHHESKNKNSTSFFQYLNRVRRGFKFFKRNTPH